MIDLGGGWQRTARGAGLIDRSGRVSPSIFAEMSALAQATGAINLGQGFPDEDGPAQVLDAAREAISLGHNQYPPGRGVPVLLEAVAEHQHRCYGITLDPATEVIATAGATEALAASLLALINGPDDEVVVFEPFYDAYAAVIALAGARMRTVPLRWPDFQPDLDELEAVVSDRTRIILLNDPHNPTGAVFGDEVLSAIVNLAHRHDAVILADEVYEHLRFDTPHRPIATLPGAAERTLTISSGGKTFSTTGWKVGWVSGPAELITAVLTVKQFLTYVNAGPFQPAIAVGLGLAESFFAAIARDMADKATRLGDGLRRAGLDVSRPRATYFTVADVAPLGFDSGTRFCRELPARAGVVAIPLSAFVQSSARDDVRTLVRFAACKRFEVIDRAVAALTSGDLAG